jgi:hypothetical protein
MKLLLECFVFLVTLPAGMGLIFGAHGVLDRVAPSWLAMGIATFAAMFVAFALAARASTPVFDGLARGAVTAAIASFFIVQPDGSGVVGGIIGAVLGIPIGWLTARGERSDAASAPAPAPGPYHALAQPDLSVRPFSGACEFCGGEGLVGVKMAGNTVDYLPNDGTSPPSYVRLPCPHCGGRVAERPPR